MYYIYGVVCSDLETITGGELSHNIRTNFNLILGVSLALYMLIGFYSIIVAVRRLCRSGVSKEMRYLFVKKHAIYVVVLIILQMI